MYQSRTKWRHRKGRKKILVADEAHARAKEMSGEYDITMSDMMNRLIYLAYENRWLVDPRELNLRKQPRLKRRTLSEVQRRLS